MKKLAIMIAAAGMMQTSLYATGTKIGTLSRELLALGETAEPLIAQYIESRGGKFVQIRKTRDHGLAGDVEFFDSSAGIDLANMRVLPVKPCVTEEETRKMLDDYSAYIAATPGFELLAAYPSAILYAGEIPLTGAQPPQIRIFTNNGATYPTQAMARKVANLTAEQVMKKGGKVLNASVSYHYFSPVNDKYTDRSVKVFTVQVGIAQGTLPGNTIGPKIVTLKSEEREIGEMGDSIDTGIAKYIDSKGGVFIRTETKNRYNDERDHYSAPLKNVEFFDSAAGIDFKNLHVLNLDMGATKEENLKMIGDYSAYLSGTPGLELLGVAVFSERPEARGSGSYASAILYAGKSPIRIFTNNGATYPTQAMAREVMLLSAEQLGQKGEKIISASVTCIAAKNSRGNAIVVFGVQIGHVPGTSI